MSSGVAWAVFGLGALVLLAIDLGLSGRRAHAPSQREALGWVALWLSLSLGLGAALWRVRGAEAGLQFFSCYLVEYALSVDNLFVFLLLFEAFRVRP